MKKIDYQLGEGVTAFTTLNDNDNFNTCHYTGDLPDNVARSRATLARELGIPTDQLIIPLQTHSANVEIIDRFINADSPELQGLDALVTDLPGKALVIHTADCVPVLLYDPVVRVIAAAHGGWKGLVGGILENTVANMINLGAKPPRIKAQFGPHICPRCYEIGPDAARAFDTDELVESGGRTYADLAKTARNRLLKVGLTPENITSRATCTYEHPDSCYSARRHAQTPADEPTPLISRHATVILLH